MENTKNKNNAQAVIALLEQQKINLESHGEKGVDKDGNSTLTYPVGTIETAEIVYEKAIGLLAEIQ